MEKIFKGYTGKELRVFLGKKQTEVREINQRIMRAYLGGVGYGAKVFYDELSPGIDPLSPENKLIFTTSPLSLHKVPGGGSIILCFKSPATNGWGESRSGGDFGPDLKKAGFDHLIIEGRSEDPVYLVINDGEVQIRLAHHLQGKSVSKKTEIIRRELPSSPRFSIMCIGLGGENLIRFATVMFEARAAGRGGAGAVMGSKNLLGIAVGGTSEVKAVHEEQFNEECKNAMHIIRESLFSHGLKQNGTIGDMPANDDAGDWPTKNWQSNSWGKGKELFDYYLENNFIKNHGCYRGCPIACGRIVKVSSRQYQTPEHEGTEYESISCFTAYVLNEDMDAAINSTYLCNEYGIDTISAGAVIAFAMECFEKGILTTKDVNGLDLSWGNSEVLAKLVTMITKREGIGNLLADGVKRASTTLGKGSEEFAVHGKGLEGPAHDPRSGKALAIAYGTANRGMCHIHPLEGMAYDSGKFHWGLIKYGVPDPNSMDRWDEAGKGIAVKILQDGLIIPDILNICKFMMYAGLTVDSLANLLSALTGWDVLGKDLLLVGERVFNLQRMFNIREGFTRKDDNLLYRVKKIPAFGKYMSEERCAIHDYDAMLEEYYLTRGWDQKTGIPTDKKLKELGLSW